MIDAASFKHWKTIRYRGLYRHTKDNPTLIIVQVFLILLAFLCGRVGSSKVGKADTGSSSYTNNNSSEQIDCNRTSDSFNPNKFPPLKRYRQYHRCTSETIPYVSNVLETAQFMLYNKNTSFVRFGDREILLLNNTGLGTQFADSNLQSKLYDILYENDSRLMIGLPDVFSGMMSFTKGAQNFWFKNDFFRQYLLNCNLPTKQYFSAFLTAPYVRSQGTSCILLPLLYQTLRSIWMGEDIVIVRGNNSEIYDYDIYDSARSQTIILAPRYNAWSAYSSLKKRIMEEASTKLYILACGPTCKVLVHDLLKVGRRGLDLGHLAKDYDSFMGNKSLARFYSE